MDFPGKDTGVGCHFLLQGISLTPGSSSCFPHWQASTGRLFYCWATREAHFLFLGKHNFNSVLQIKKVRPTTSLMVWWVRVPASDARGSGLSLVGELGSSVLQGTAPSPTPYPPTPAQKERKPRPATHFVGLRTKWKRNLWGMSREQQRSIKPSTGSFWVQSREPIKHPWKKPRAREVKVLS